MKLVLVFALLGPLFANAETETRIRGAAAVEMYDALAIVEAYVRDEHGGPVIAIAKYGKRIGCSKDIAGGTVECWVRQD